MENELDTDLSHYTINDIFSLLDINITSDADYNVIREEIISKTNKYIEKFTSLNNSKMVQFFKNVQTYLTENRDSNVSIVKDPKPHGPKMGGSTNQTESTTGVGNISYNSNDGAGNPIHRKTITKLLNIDSRHRDTIYPLSTNYLINLQDPINNVIEMKLCDLELPTTYYPISTYLNNNYMWIKITKFRTVETYIFYYLFIPDGNYYYDDLITYILSVDALGNTNFSIPINILFDLNYQNSGGVGTGTGKNKIGIFGSVGLLNQELQYVTNVELNFTGSAIPSVTQTLQVTDPAMLSFYTPVENTNIQLKMGWLLGYRKALYTGSKFYISESVMDIIGPRYLYLIIKDGTNGLNTNVNFISANGTGLDGDTIARISLKGPAFNVQAQNDFSVYTEPRYFYGPKKIEKITIMLVDEYSRIVNLNQNDFSFTLRLTTIYTNN